MSRTSSIFGLSGILAALTVSVSVASAGSVVVHTTTPPVVIHPAVTPKANFKPLVTGKHIPVATITAGKASAGSGDFKFTKQTDKSSAVLYDKKNNSGDGKPTESMSLNFEKIEWTAKPQ